MVMAAKLARMTHRIAIQSYLVAERCTICSFRSRRPVRKLLDTLSYPVLRYVFMTWWLDRRRDKFTFTYT